MMHEVHRDATDDERHGVLVESEPFLTAFTRSPSVTPPSEGDDAELNSDATLSRSGNHSSRHTGSASSHSHMSARLLHALPPQLSQWLQPTAPPQSSSQSRSRVRVSRPHEELTNHARVDMNAIITLGQQPTLSADVIAARRLDSGESIETSHHTSRRRSESTERPETERPSATLRVIASTATRPQLDRSSQGQDTEDRRVLPSSPVAVTAASVPIPDSLDSDLPSRAESPRSTTSSDDMSQHEELSTMDELSTLFRRCHHSLPFAALFLVYFAYQHATGILVFIIGSVAIVGLDERLRTQIALKQDANRVYLVGIFAMSVVDSGVVSVIGGGDLNPFRHLFTQRLEAPLAQANTSGALFVDVVWLVLVNDFILRFWSLAAKAIVALLQSETWWLCGLRRPVVIAGVGAAHSSTVTPATVDSDDLEQGSRYRLSRSSVAFYRRKRKLYGIIELSSIFARSLLAGVPWCSYYQLCSSKFVGDVFTFVYIFGKGIILATQGRQILQLVRSFVTQGLEHATYVTRDELEHAGSPDCSICYEAMLNPVKLSCSHLFCEECVMEWFDRERSCPLCRAAIISPASPSTTGSGTEIKPQFLDGRTSLFPQFF